MKFNKRYGYLLLGSLALISIIALSCMLFKKSSQKISIETLRTKKNIAPVVVIGSGPAGLSAALFTARANFPTFVITGQQEGGQLMEAAYVENWPTKQKASGSQMMQDLKEQAQHFGVRIVPTYVEHVDVSQHPFIVHLNNGDELLALSLIVATGGSQRTLPVPGVKEYWAKGIGICTICDAPFDKDKEVAVIGGGDAACDKALQLAAFAKHVTILVRDKEMRAAAVVQNYVKDTPNISIRYNCAIEKIDGDGNRVSAVEVKDSKTSVQETLPIYTVYFALGFTPNSQLFKGKLELDKDGYIVRKPGTQKTSVEGVFAAGNIEDAVYQKASIASGAGARAGIDAIQFLQDKGFTPVAVQELASVLYQPEEGKQSITQLSNDVALEKAIANDKIIIIEFYAKTCPICKMVGPYFGQASAKFNGEVVFANADVQAVEKSAQYYSLDTTPLFILFSNGKEQARSNSLRTQQDIVDFINKNKK